ncbi:hypothetical protein M758_8G014300 [Ceratodon purpureus]|nr:hypothetical protein M758_8G014300 [Ceratodon purpureus]
MVVRNSWLLISLVILKLYTIDRRRRIGANSHLHHIQILAVDLWYWQHNARPHVLATIGFKIHLMNFSAN